MLDLYCGAGSISIFIADAVERVLGVEIVEDAIKNANDNKKINRIFNVDFICSDIKKFIAGNDINEFNKIIIDPPRSGIHPDIATALSDSRMEKNRVRKLQPVNSGTRPEDNLFKRQLQN